MTASGNSQKQFDATELIEKVGGTFKLTSLIQKRLRELNAGDRPLVNVDTKDPLKIVAEEIRQGKINLIPEDERENLE